MVPLAVPCSYARGVVAWAVRVRKTPAAVRSGGGVAVVVEWAVWMVVVVPWWRGVVVVPW